jgi:Ca-activated chloride channel family protein
MVGILGTGRFPVNRRLATLAGFALLAAVGSPADSSADEGETKSNILIILDASGSMAEKMGGDVKMEVAKQVVGDLVTNLPSTLNVGLMIYGSRPKQKRDCTDIALVQPVGAPNSAAVSAALRDVRPLGMTPIGGSLEQAAVALQGLRGPSTIVLVTDGDESCGADPCAVAREVHRRTGIDVKIHVVGLALETADQQRLTCVAKDGGGKYYSANTTAELRSALTEVVKPPPPPPRGGQRSMWWSILHPGLGEWKNSGKSFDEGCPKGKFWLGMIPGFGWPGYLQVVSAIDAFHGKTNDWPESGAREEAAEGGVAP